MASVKFIDRPEFRTKFQESDYAITKILYRQPYGVRVRQELPFRVRFTTIGVPSYGLGNVPPIGIAIIGFNNYIL
jgi:hypothetical protein